jgi:hypothetical protein
MVRGGAWHDDADDLRIDIDHDNDNDNDNDNDADDRNDDVGFRVVAPANTLAASHRAGGSRRFAAARGRGSRSTFARPLW